MKSVYFVISVLLIASGAVGLSVSENVDQVPPPPPRPTKKDDGSADLKPPPPPPPPQPANDNRFSGSSVVAEASVYDPSIYPGLLPSGLPGYPDPFPGGYPPQPYAPLGYVHPSGYPTPYVVQTGYEGYLVPAPPPVMPVDTTDPLAFMRGLLPRSMITWISRSMAVLVGGMAIVFMGGAITTALCSLTPFCSISFKSLSLFNWNETARDVGKMLGKEITPERVRRTANLVRTAIRKYSELQRALGDEPDTYGQ